jgi:uncharacterized membrane protein
MQEKCSLNEKEYASSEGLFWKQLRPSVQEFLKKTKPDWKGSDFISYDALNSVLNTYIIELIAEEQKAGKDIAKKVQHQLKTDEELKPIHKHTQEEALTYGQRLADKIADFGGSWTFILIFVFIIIVWMAVNIYYLSNKGFDPYPFILLNLVLSCLAALQAPVIMMSQNRQEDKDRQRAEYDVSVNVKAEKEVRLLHEKLDHVLLHQHQNIVELYQLHLDLVKQMQQRLDIQNKNQ